MKYYTLCYQPQTSINRIIAVSTSDSLIKLIKIKYATFHNSKGFSYIIRTADLGNKDAFLYGLGCLHVTEIYDFMRFVEKVDKGKYYKTYNYTQRVRELVIRRA